MLNLFRLPSFFEPAKQENQDTENLIRGILANYYKHRKGLSEQDFEHAQRLVSNEFQAILKNGTLSPENSYEQLSAALRNIERDLP